MKPDRPGRRRIVAAAWIAAVAMLALAIPFAARAEFGKAGTQAASSPADGLPNISLVDQNGRAISLSSLKGRPALVAFIHTQCEGPCELITANMKRVARNLGPGFASEVTMVSITTEPKEDGSRELRAGALRRRQCRRQRTCTRGAQLQFGRRAAGIELRAQLTA